MFNFIDKWIDRLDGQVECSLPAEESIKKIAANIAAVLSGQEKSLLFVGSINKSNIQMLCEQLSAYLPNTISCKAAGNILTDAETVKLVTDCDCIVLVEQEGKSTYPIIEQEIQAIKDLNKSIVGFVLVNE